MLVEKVEHSGEKIVFVHTTVSSRDEAKSMAFSVVEEKLAVCADFWAIESIYPWQGVIEEVEQYMVMFTTESSLSSKLVSFISELHSYSVPMISVSETKFMNPAYSFWADKTLHDKTDYLSHDEKEKQLKYEAEGGFHPGHLK